jgi:hypothetical protein
MSYRDDLAGAQSRADALERELAEARNQGAYDRARLDGLERELGAARQAIASLQRGIPPTYGGYEPSHSTSVLVLGILSLVACSLLGPIAWQQGTRELERIDAGLVDPSTRGTVTAGRTCGIVGTVMLGFGVFAILLILAAG